MSRIVAILLLVPALAFAQTPTDQLCLRCDRWGGSQGGGGGASDLGSRPAIDSACYTGNAVDGRQIEVGFHPAFMLIRNIDNENPNAIEWRFDFYASDSSCASQNPPCHTNGIMSTAATSVTLGTDNNVNANGEPYCWFALSTQDQFISTGSYVGNGTFFDLALPFVPDAVLIFARTYDAGTTAFSIIDMADQGAMMDVSADWQDDFVTAYNLPTEFTPASITIRNGSATFGEMNTADMVYDYIAFNKQTGAVDAGIYTGDGLATQTIVTECPEIAAIFIRPEQSTEFPCAGYRTTAMIPAFNSDINARWIAGWQGTETGGITDIAGNTGSFTVNVNALDTIISDCNENSALYAWFAICKGQEIASVAAFDPHTLLRAAYSFETAANAAVPNMPGTQCGSDCDMGDVNSVPRSTTEFREKLQSIDPAGVDDSLTCARATCANGTTDINIGTSASWGCWGRLEADANSRGVFYGGGTAGNNANWALLRNATNDLINCRVTTTGDSAVTAAGATNSWAINTWFAQSCVFDDTANTVQAYKNAVATGSAGSVASMTSTLAADPRIAANQVLTSTAFFDGQIDACWLYAGVMTTGQLCYLASCGLDGTECTCLASDPTLYTDTGRNTDAGACTLPACDTGGF